MSMLDPFLSLTDMQALQDEEVLPVTDQNDDIHSEILWLVLAALPHRTEATVSTTPTFIKCQILGCFDTMFCMLLLHVFVTP